MAKIFKSTHGSRVTKKEAMEWIDKYDQEMRPDKEKDTKSIFYGRDVLLNLLSQEGSAGITFFLASRYEEAAKKETTQLVLVATTEDGKLLWGDDGISAQKTSEGGSGVFDRGAPCPPYCPT
ncbi:MAG: hypothetical protein WKF87_00420 [Chryseolinea sp.]